MRERGLRPRAVAMADAEEAGDGKKAAAPKSKKKLFVIGGAAAVALLGGVGGYFALAGGKDGEHAEAMAEAHAAPAKAAAFVELPEMTVNLATADQDKQQYVRMTVALEVANPETVEAITPTYLWRHRPHGQFQPPRVDEASRVDV